LVNISAGKYHRDCGGECRICSIIDGLAQEDIVTIAGAGNRKADESLGVFCPAKSTSSIAVGMSQIICTATPNNKSMPLGANSLESRPPGAYWAKRHNAHEFYPNDTYCGFNGCSPIHQCENNRRVEYWEGNVDWDEAFPEVVAPGLMPMINESETGGELEPGTSFSTALVTGGVACILSEVFPNQVGPQRLKRTVEASSRNLDCGIVGQFDMEMLKDRLS
jgi:hypothetical protein